MKKKKIISIILIGAFFCGVLTSCGAKTEYGDTTVETGSTAAVSESCATTEKETVTTEQTTESTTAVTTLPSSTEKVTEKATEKVTKKSGAATTQKATEKVVETTKKKAVVSKPIPFNGAANYGEKTGTSKTYTGLEPLKKVSFNAPDPDNSRGLSTKTVEHCYGVSTGGKPHNISVENQKIYAQYGGLCLDTSGEKVIYLTFDCGYENGVTSKILNVLKEKGVPAAFFVTLPYIESSPKLVARMINEGHTVGNHSNTHPNFSTISRQKMADEILAVDNVLRTKFGYSAPFFRFPEGAYNESALELVQSMGYKSVFWSSAYADWDTSNQKGAKYAFDTVTSRLHPGCVLLLHAVSQDNAEALADIIDWAKAKGYTFKALS